MKRYGPRRNYLILGEYKPEEVFPFITVEETRRDFTAVDGKQYSVRMNSDRYYCFNKNPKCVCCGIEGETLLLEMHRNQKEKHPHFNFYARHNGDLILMTKDHIVAKANGGPDIRDNLQTMCTICNNLKRSFPLTVEELREKRRRYDMMDVREVKGLARTKFLGLYELEYGHRGKSRKWVFCSRKQKETIEAELKGEQPASPDAVVIFATVGNRVVVTKEFRPVVGGYEYGLPAGLVDGGESEEEAARRELFEETGLTVADVRYTSPILYSSAGCMNECVKIVSCTAEGEISADHCEPGEDIQTFLMDAAQVKRLVHATDEFAGVKIGAKAWPLLMAWIAV